MTLEPDRMETDVLVIGGGMAGQRAAMAARSRGADVVQAYVASGASPFLVGMNVPLAKGESADSPDLYAADMIDGGCGLNDRRLVSTLVTRAREGLSDLCALGVPFAQDGDRFLLRHLSGNRRPRTAFSTAREGMGNAVLRRLRAHVRKSGVQVLSGWRAVSLLHDQGAVCGALLFEARGGRLAAVGARSVVIAAGGMGRLYADSTYPRDVAGDSYALAFRVGARLIDMEFVQFEPTVVVHPAACRGIEMATALLGDGAQLLNSLGERFMCRYNPVSAERQIDKAPLSLCIQQEIDEGRALPDGGVLFDTTVVPRDLLEGYAVTCRRLRSKGLEPTTEGQQVAPAAHSHMGGILVDDACWTGIAGLFAAGEATGGLHGASRLAGNSGSDTVVFGLIAGASAASFSARRGNKTDWRRAMAAATTDFKDATSRGGELEPKEVARSVRRILSRDAGIYRDDAGLRRAESELEALSRDLAGGRAVSAPPRTDMARLAARNMVLVARIIAKAALLRRESRGAHQRRDYPQQDDRSWRCHIECRMGEKDDIALSKAPVQGS